MVPVYGGGCNQLLTLFTFPYMHDPTFQHGALTERLPISLDDLDGGRTTSCWETLWTIESQKGWVREKAIPIPWNEHDSSPLKMGRNTQKESSSFSETTNSSGANC